MITLLSKDMQDFSCSEPRAPGKSKRKPYSSLPRLLEAEILALRSSLVILLSWITFPSCSLTWAYPSIAIFTFCTNAFPRAVSVYFQFLQNSIATGAVFGNWWDPGL